MITAFVLAAALAAAPPPPTATIRFFADGSMLLGRPVQGIVINLEAIPHLAALCPGLAQGLTVDVGLFGNTGDGAIRVAVGVTRNQDGAFMTLGSIDVWSDQAAHFTVPRDFGRCNDWTLSFARISGGSPASFVSIVGLSVEPVSGDFNADGVVDSQDFFDFMAAFSLAGLP